MWKQGCCVCLRHQECGPPCGSRITGLRVDFIHQRVVTGRWLAYLEGSGLGPQSKVGWDPCYVGDCLDGLSDPGLAPILRRHNASATQALGLLWGSRQEEMVPFPWTLIREQAVL